MPDVTQRRRSAARKAARTARPRESGIQGCARVSFVIAGLDPAIHAASGRTIPTIGVRGKSSMTLERSAQIAKIHYPRFRSFSRIEIIAE
jgi:hypothetical protein